MTLSLTRTCTPHSLFLPIWQNTGYTKQVTISLFKVIDVSFKAYYKRQRKLSMLLFFVIIHAAFILLCLMMFSSFFLNLTMQKLNSCF